MASSIDDTNNEFRSVSGTGKTRLEEAMSHAASSAGLWVASEAHSDMGIQEVIEDPPVTNGVGDPMSSHA